METTIDLTAGKIPNWFLALITNLKKNDVSWNMNRNYITNSTLRTNGIEKCPFITSYDDYMSYCDRNKDGRDRLRNKIYNHHKNKFI